MTRSRRLKVGVAMVKERAAGVVEVFGHVGGCAEAEGGWWWRGLVVRERGSGSGEAR